MSFWNVNWRTTVEKYEGRAHKFLHASRRLNILSNDMLRYLGLCEAAASLARDGHILQTEMNAEIIKVSKTKDKATKLAGIHKLNSYNKQLGRIHSTLLKRTRELEKVRKRYLEHIDLFSKALK